MIPIRDTQPSLTKPVVVKLLIAVNIALFAYEWSLGERFNEFMRTYGLVPSVYFERAAAGEPLYARMLPVFTSMFLHGGFFHVGFNMLFLWIFGDNVEDMLGRVRFVFFYLACGAAGAYAQLYFAADSNVPMVGASGAIAGVMGAYLLLFPRARVMALVPIFFILQIVELPAFVFLGFWFLLQFVSGAAALLSASQGGGTAWWAHIGGFAAGLLLVKPLQKRRIGSKARRARHVYGMTGEEDRAGKPRGFAGRRSSGGFRISGP
jgi:hypothetical protein